MEGHAPRWSKRRREAPRAMIDSPTHRPYRWLSRCVRVGSASLSVEAQRRHLLRIASAHAAQRDSARALDSFAHETRPDAILTSLTNDH